MTIFVTLIGVKVTQSCLTLVTPWTVAYQAPLFMNVAEKYLSL